MAQERKHTATYSYNQRAQQYLVRVVGPHADKFAGKEIPVTRKGGAENTEQLIRVTKSGIDEGKVTPENKGKPYALYTFVQKPRGEADEQVEF